VKRLFIGLDFGENVSEPIQRAIRKMKTTFDQREIAAKWSQPQDLHITLVFIGERPDEDVDNIRESVEKVVTQHKAFDLKLSGMGAFPDIQSARVLWLGVQKRQELLDLQSEIEAALLSTSENDYIPHVTVAKIRNLKSVRSIISPFLRQKWGQIHVGHVVLFESIQQGPYAIYKPLAKFKLQSP
jgi:RNA 2',3'-cyclic 3'-phosphodiesterase